MPAQPLLVLAAGGDEVLTVVDQQAMSSAAPSRCAPARFSIPSFSAARATVNASIESDLPRSRDERLAPAIGRGHFSDTPRWRTGIQRDTSPAAERQRHAAICCPTVPSRVLACRAERCLTSRRPAVRARHRPFSKALRRAPGRRPWAGSEDAPSPAARSARSRMDKRDQRRSPTVNVSIPGPISPTRASVGRRLALAARSRAGWLKMSEFDRPR